MLSAVARQGRQCGALAPLMARGMAMSGEVVTGLNVQKQGSDPPLKADADLPPWLFELATPAKTLNELRRTKEEDLGVGELARIVKLGNREKIRDANERRSK